jgi:Holliday junction resolvasome RuvABC DNA-binding subunit
MKTARINKLNKAIESFQSNGWNVENITDPNGVCDTIVVENSGLAFIVYFPNSKYDNKSEEKFSNYLVEVMSVEEYEGYQEVESRDWFGHLSDVEGYIANYAACLDVE